MAHGIFDLVGLAAALVFALPIALFGLQRLGSGEPLMGLALLCIAVGMVLVEEYVTTPRDVPKEVASAAVERAVDSPDDEE